MAPKPTPPIQAAPQTGIRAQAQAIPHLQPIRQSTIEYVMGAEGTQAAQTGTGSFRGGTFRPYQQGDETWPNGATKYTIGYGHVLDQSITDPNHAGYNKAVRDAWFNNGLTPGQAEGQLRVDFKAHRATQLATHNRTHGAGFFERLHQDKQDLLADTHFQAGNNGTMPRMAAELARGNIERALVESWFRAEGDQADGIRNRTQSRRRQFFPELRNDYTEFNQQYPMRNMGVRWNKWNKVPLTGPHGGEDYDTATGRHGAPGLTDWRPYNLISGVDPAWYADPTRAERIGIWETE